MQRVIGRDIQFFGATTKNKLHCLVYFGGTLRDIYYFRIIFDLLCEKFNLKTAICDTANDFLKFLLDYHDSIYLYTWTFKPEKWRSIGQIGKLVEHFRVTWRLFLHNSRLAFH